ncbi:MAG: site-specific DNA-methyltransferase [Eubacterium sp.]|jgi:adenine-specific DNA-methyltransferase|uniref:site-specific DNA-methyltransferase n=1 Tax=Eubacterium sp. F2 TaxID=3381348 RepID=UPI00390801F7|nr:site-specific DNA-methyltransferase [Eubacterium sp.]MCI2196464.1 site-specific DNA-methyltransferase [Eubacterium sp.]
MDKMRMESEDIQQENVAKIAALFPNCVTEARDEDGHLKKAINFELLKQMLSDSVIDGDEAYEFTWVGKKASIVEANRPIRKTLRPVKEDSVNWDTTENLYIEGDNLEVLKLLQESYLGKVKMIYIDPPYNTGNDFIYNDDFKVSSEEYADESGQVDEEGNRMFKNTDSNGRFHSDWCSMVYSRLLVARNFLTSDGVIFISIDENESGTLKLICDEVFGESNFIAQLVWSAGRKNDSKYISVSHEYIFCYFKDAQFIKDHNIVWRERKEGLNDIYAEFDSLKKLYGTDYERIKNELRNWYKNLPDSSPAKEHAHYNKVDERGIYFSDNISWPGGGGPKYNLLHPVTGKPVKIPSRGWLTNEKTMHEWIKQGRVDFGKNETYVPTLKSYLKDREYTVPYSVFYKDGRASSKRLATLMGDKVFENPKDEEIIQRLIEMCGTDDGDIVMDFFSGSATTAHAVFLANLHQNKRRKFILVQLPETIDPSKSTAERSKKVAKNAIALLDSIDKPHNICEIGKERIRRAAKKIHEDNPDATFDDGFRVLKLDDTNMNDVYYAAGDYTQDLVSRLESNVKPDRTDLDLLFGCLLDWGLPLSLPYTSETIDGCMVHTYNDGDLIACFDENVPESVIKTIAKRQPLRAVFRDSSFASSPEKINVGEIFKLLAPDTRVKVI